MLKRLAAAIPDLGLAAAFVLALGGGFEAATREHLFRAALLEFPAIHCGGFLMMPWIAGWEGAKKLAVVGGLLASYVLSLTVVSLVMGVWWTLPIFLGLVANRAVGIALMPNPDGREMDRLAHAWGGSIALFAAAAIISGMGGTRGAVYVAAVCYFGATGLSELTNWGWVRRWMAWAQRSGPAPRRR